LAQPEAATLAPLAWLTGCWAAEGAETGSVEQWLEPAGATMLGVSRTVKGGKTVAHEFMQIRLNAEGRVVFIALPSGQTEASFLATTLTDSEVVFENALHDFPQRVIYRSLPGGRLVARIEGVRRGTARAVDFPMQRVSCNAPAAAPAGR
ncbi:MAG: hypothetical protein H7Z19_10985, partial [Chitinophagaceae bacterium]|nr:hypothetical protein [Rubrivivax sp.]